MVRQQRAAGMIWKKERKKMEGMDGNRKQEGGPSSVSYISWLNESVQKSELSGQ